MLSALHLGNTSISGVCRAARCLAQHYRVWTVSPDMSMGLTGLPVCSISNVRFVHLVYGIIVDDASCVFLWRIFRALLRPGDIVTVAFDYTLSSPIPASSHDVKYRGLLPKCVHTIWHKVGNYASKSGRVFRYFCYGCNLYVRISRSVNFVWDLRL